MKPMTAWSIAWMAMGGAWGGMASGCGARAAGGAAYPKTPEEIVSDAFQAKGPLARPESWADCERFGGVVTPANFDPQSDPFDELYMMPGSPGFLDGVPLISESKPGDQDYNGGRWHLNVLEEGADPAVYAGACAVEELDPEDFVPTDLYFECPLLPRRGNAP